MKAHLYTLLVVGATAVTAWAQADRSEPVSPRYVGRVTGDSVYIRSGPDTNYYALGQVGRGQTVRIFGEQFGWLKIQPLPGMYSLVEQNYLDVSQDGRGIVNADRVNVRAGADSTPHVYARQLKLDRGAEVRILGKRQATLGGQTMSFYQIEPPPGAYVWIKADYVEAADGELESPSAEATEEQSEPNRSDEPRVAAMGEIPSTTDATAAPAAPSALPDAADGSGSPVLRERLATIETDLKAEFEKPLLDRRFAPVRGAFAELAHQDTDRVVKRFAELRLDQIDHQIQMIETILSLREQDRELDDYRQEAIQARAEIRVSTIDVPRTFTLAGELRRSHIYDSPALPCRYRLVDPAETPPRTLAYVEIPKEAELDPVPLLGRYVGISEASRTYHKGLVDTIPVIVPAEIVVIDRPTVLPTEEAQSPTILQLEPDENTDTEQ